ncbi:MAG: hypothetical protein AMJ43_06930 [Coxiella sp. DG_40]|nr:MAG: hypothetical protein AMJ43_06930 [Coxiella sp. DG_40]
MKKLVMVLLVLFLGMASVAIGEVSTRVCLSDGNTPLPPVDTNFPYVYPDIMVGTKLTIIVSSNTAEYWSGSLAITGEDMNYGILSARDFNENTFDWEGSRFPAAGTGARVYTWEESGVYGFDLYGHSSAVAGDWFIIDYNATSVGDCNIGFYDHSISWMDPIYYLAFSHVRTRDFNKDTKVDFTDFEVFASYWQVANCNDPNWCEGTDLDTDGSVDMNDLALFVDYWLEITK